MNPIYKRKQFFIFLAATVAAVVLLGFTVGYLAQKSLETETARSFIIDRFSDLTGGTLTFERAEVRLLLRPGIWFHRVAAEVPNLLEAEGPRIGVFPALLPLLKGEIRVAKLILEKPRLKVSPFPLPTPQHPNLPDGAAVLGLSLTAHKVVEGLPVLSMVVRNGRIEYEPASGTPFLMTDLNLNLKHESDRFAAHLETRSNYWDRSDFFLKFDKKIKAIRGHISVGQLHAPELFGPLFDKSPVRLTSGKPNLSVDLSGTSGELLTADLSMGFGEIGFRSRSGEQKIQKGHVDAKLRIEPKAIKVLIEGARFGNPKLNITGSLRADLEKPDFAVRLEGKDLDVGSVRQASLFFAGTDAVTQDIFEIIKGGTVPWISFTTDGRSLEDLSVFRRMRIDGQLAGGSIFAPGADLDLTSVNGTVKIENGILEGTDLSAAYGNSTASEGSLHIDLESDRTPLMLNLPIKADLTQLPPVLMHVVPDPTFVRELKTIEGLEGKATGVLDLDDWDGPMQVTVDVSNFNLSGRYGRIPLPVRIQRGRFRYADDGVSLRNASGSLGGTTFRYLSAGIGLKPPYQLTVGRASAALSLEELLPWLTGYAPVRAVTGSTATAEGEFKIEHLNLSGPLWEPQTWQYRLDAAFRNLRLKATFLPWQLKSGDGKLLLTPDMLALSDAKARFLDGEVRMDAEFANYRDTIDSCRISFSGRLGDTAAQWISETTGILESYRLATPLLVEAGQLEWTDAGGISFSGSMSVPAGTRLTIDISQNGEHLNLRRLAVEDQDSKATGAIEYDGRHLTAAFSGNLSGNSLERLFGRSDLPEGFARGALETRIDLKSPHRSTIQGRLTAEAFTIPHLLPPGMVLEQADIQASGESLSLSPMVLTHNGNRNTIKGTIQKKGNGLDMDLDLDADEIDLSGGEDHDGLQIVTGDPLEKLYRLNVLGTLRARIGRLNYEGLTVSPIKADITLYTGGYESKVTEAYFCGLYTTGTIASSNGRWRLSLQTEAKGSDFSSTITCMSKDRSLIDGRYTFRGDFSADARENLIANTSGPVTLTAQNGRIYRLNMLSKILAVVNVTEIFRGRMPDLLKDGFAYDNLSLSGALSDGVLIIDEAIIDGASMELAGSGTVDLTNREADLTVLVAPLKTLDTLVKYTPIINDLLDGNLVSIPVKVTGDIADPKIVPLDPRSVGSNILGLMKKTFGLPAKLFQPLRNLGGSRSGDSSDSEPITNPDEEGR